SSDRRIDFCASSIEPRLGTVVDGLGGALLFPQNGDPFEVGFSLSQAGSRFGDSSVRGGDAGTRFIAGAASFIDSRLIISRPDARQHQSPANRGARFHRARPAVGASRATDVDDVP